jgi:hypothetical protein
MAFTNRSSPGQDPDLIDIIDTYNEAMEKARKNSNLPTGNIYLIAVQKAYSDRIYPQYRQRWSYTIGDWEHVGRCGRDYCSAEERQRIMKQRSDGSNIERQNFGN